MRFSRIAALLSGLLLSIILGSPSWALPACADKPSGLVSWWRGEGSADDQLGNNNGTVQGSLSYAAGKVGQAFDMSAGGYVQLPAAAANLTQGTIMLWVKYNSIQENNQPFGSADYTFTILNMSTGYGGVFMFGIQIPPPEGWAWKYAFSAVAPTTGQWYHVAGTWGPDGVKIYVNGQLSVNTTYSSDTYTGPSMSTAYNLIGRFMRERWDGWVYSTVDGLIDEVALFNRALSASEIAAIYNADSAGMCLDTTPDPFSFISQTGMPLNTTILSNPVTITGIDSGTAVSVSGGQYAGSTDGGSTWGGWTSSGTIDPGAVVKVSVQSSPTDNTTITATLTVGTATATFSVTTAAAGDPDGTGLIAWWRAENNACDSLGYHNGALKSSATFGTGKLGEAFSLDGTGGYIEADAIELATTFSVDAWIRPEDLSPAGENIFNKDNGVVRSYFFGHDSSGCLIASVRNTTGDYTQYRTTSPVLTAGSWNHVTLVYDGSAGADQKMLFYVNGQSKAALHLSSYDNGGAPETGALTTKIGIFGDASGSAFNGKIDEVKLFSRALSSAEVSAMYCMVPKSFSFIDQTGMPVNTKIVSNPINVQNITCDAPITVSGGQYNVSNDGGNSWIGWTNAPGNLNSAQTNKVKVRLTSSASCGTTSSATLTIGGVSSTFTVTTASAGDPDASGLISWWRADGNAYDSVSGHNGSPQGNTAYSTGKTGQAFSFDGSGDYVSITDPNLNLAVTDAVTVAGWIYLNTITTGASVFNRRTAGNAGGITLEIAAGNTIVFCVKTSAGWQYAISPDNSITTGAWYYVAGTYDSNTIRLFINGAEVASTPCSGPINTPASPLVWIGSNIPNPSLCLNGLVDELKIYGRTLTGAEISGLAGTRPDAFNFIDQTGMPRNVTIVSNPITVTGITNPAAISVTGDSGSQYRINGGSWTTASGTVNPGDTVEVQVTSSAANNATASATLTIGGVSDTFSVTTASADDPDATGLVAWWKADGNALDSVGGNDGTLVNGTTFAAGQVGQAFSFDGADDAISVGMLGNTALNETMPFSISAWINSSDTSGNQAIAGNNQGENQPPFNRNYSAFLLIQSGALIFELNEKQTLSTDAQTPISTGWHYVAATYDGSVMKLYLDGILEDSTTRNFSGAADNTRGWYIGNFAPNYNASFNGLIDELKVYNRALSASEVGKISGQVPDAFSFIDQTGVPINSPVQSNVITVTGTSFASPISITGGDYAISSDNITWGGWTSTDGTVNPGDKVKVRLTSSASYLTVTTATLTIGGVSGRFAVTTAPEFSSGVTNYDFEIDPADTAGGSITGWTYDFYTYNDYGTRGSSPTVSAHELKTTSDRFFSGGKSVYSFIRTATTGNNQDPNTNYPTHDLTANYVLPAGRKLDALTIWRSDVSYTTSSRYFYQFYVELSDGTNSSQTMMTCRDWGYNEGCSGNYQDSHDQTAAGADGQTWYRHRIPVPANLDQSKLTVTVRHVERSWDGSIAESGLFYDLLGEETLVADQTPDPFSFIDQTGMPLNTMIVSNPVTVTGIDVATAVSITGGEYTVSTDGGSTWGGWTSASGYVSLNSQVKVRLTSSASFSTLTTATLTIGGVSGSFNVTTAAASDPNASGLVAWWKAENNAYDSIGGNHGTLMNGATFAAGQVGQAYSFDGTNAYVSVPHNDNLNPSAEQTLEFWLYFYSLPADYKDLIQKGIGGTRTQYYVRTNNSNDIEFASCISDRCYTMAPYTDNALSYAALGITAGNWYHIAFVVNDSAKIAYAYVNGVEKGSTAGYSASNPENTGELTFGGFSWDGYFPGRLDEIKIYNRALSASEVGKISGQVPDAFSFIDQSGIARSEVIESNSITVTGTSYPTAISIAGADGEYAVSTDNGSTWGAWTNAGGTVAPNSKVKVKVISSVSYATTVDTTLTIGGVSDTFSATTGPEPTTTSTTTSIVTTTSSVTSTTSISTTTSSIASTTVQPTTTTSSVAPSTTIVPPSTTTTVVPSSSTTTSVVVTTTTTVPPSTSTTVATTTTTAPKCPFARSSSSPSQTQSLRQLRDTMLDTALGIRLATLYYQNLEEIGAILQSDDALNGRFSRIVRGNMPVVKGLLIHGSAAMSGDDIAEVHEFLSDLQEHGGVQLQQDIEFVLRGIESGWLLSWSGITIK